ncbi:unnamed protein product [Ceutorhynchus assimilis]|uniref:WD repeat-containing and planar cell polarity effector protein fritz n=1 Tax=Ceutorhynchus assimilis TaxID=467358 RepID=A0A9N9QGN5_9CUCU|nr:unnamed protein product [Ceutorhynchus assimilis]CAG9764223.1 unnamed protein product [Ceutorhynchus assimilis]
MATFLSEIHFWTTQEDIVVKDTDYGSYKYYQKKDITNLSQHAQAKKLYCDQSSIVYIPNNKRPEKLRDKLKELEDHLIHNKVIFYCWNDNNTLSILLSTGLIVIITQQNGDLMNISFDKQLFVKLQCNIICDGALFGNNQTICVCNDGHILGFGGYWKEGWVLDGGNKRKLHYDQDWLVVYGKITVEHPQPWSPLTKDHQRANLHLYNIGCRDPELLAYRKTDGEPLLVVINKTSSDKHLIVVEQKVTQNGQVSLELSTFQLIQNNLKRLTVTSVPLQTQVSCTSLSHNKEKLLISCIDGTLAILDRHRGSTRIIKTPFIATLASWHPENVIVTIANERGFIQHYDIALNVIKTQEEAALHDLSGYNSQFIVASINWGPKDLIIAFEQGPLAILTHQKGSFGLKSVAKQYLKANKVEQAVKLLLSWEFDDKAFFLLQQVAMQLLRRNLTEEVAQCLQEALGCFHCAPVPLSAHVRHKFGHQVMCITRRFFYQLLRTSMFETAFLLAVDVGHHDLFMDLHYIAVKLGETEMAAAARAQASALLSRCSSEASNCSRSLCSQCSDSQSCSSTNYEEEMPKEITTDFMQPNPTTYNQRPPENLNAAKKTFPPRATYVKAPQVPLDFVKQQQTPLYRSYIREYVDNIPTNNDMEHNIPGLPVPFYRFKPPLPNVQKLPPKNNQNLIDFDENILPKTKNVKFSDTVTAFIVPEVKRAVKPPPLPPHLTDPQRELAASLPLCHPNEDYLKDFAPVRKEGEGESGETGLVPPKIKVVHFGVV